MPLGNDSIRIEIVFDVLVRRLPIGFLGIVRHVEVGVARVERDQAQWPAAARFECQRIPRAMVEFAEHRPEVLAALPRSGLAFEGRTRTCDAQRDAVADSPDGNFDPIDPTGAAHARRSVIPSRVLDLHAAGPPIGIAALADDVAKRVPDAGAEEHGARESGTMGMGARVEGAQKIAARPEPLNSVPRTRVVPLWPG